MPDVLPNAAGLPDSRCTYWMQRQESYRPETMSDVAGLSEYIMPLDSPTKSLPGRVYR